MGSYKINAAIINGLGNDVILSVYEGILVLSNIIGYLTITKLNNRRVAPKLKMISVNFMLKVCKTKIKLHYSFLGCL